MIMYLLILVCVFLARAFKAAADRISEGSFNKDYWSKDVSWKNKWKLFDGELRFNDKKLWYYLWLYSPRFVERFPYSSTFFVSFTDGWHLMNMFRYLFWILSVGFAMHYDPYRIWLVDILFVWMSGLVGFTVFYDYLLPKIFKKYRELDF